MDFIGDFGYLIKQSPLSLSQDTYTAFKEEIVTLSK